MLRKKDILVEIQAMRTEWILLQIDKMLKLIEEQNKEIEKLYELIGRK